MDDDHYDVARAAARCADAERAAGRRIALVPTMGALHAGHLALVAEARRRARPRRGLDLREPDPVRRPARPRGLSAHARRRTSRRAATRGVDVVFAPDGAGALPGRRADVRRGGELAQPLCGASRPGHFRGVATVVAKLLLAAKPHVAVFGEKDYQQLAVIRRLARDLRLDVEIVGRADRARARRARALEPQRATSTPRRGARRSRSRARSTPPSARSRAGERDAARLLARVRARDRERRRAPSSTTPSCATPTRSRRRRRDSPAPTLLALAVFPPRSRRGRAACA